MGKTSRGGRAIVALGISLGVHALLIGWVVRRPIPPPAQPPVVSAPPSVDFEVALPPAEAPANRPQHRHRKPRPVVPEIPKRLAQSEPRPAAAEAPFVAPVQPPGVDEGRRLELRAVLPGGPEGSEAAVTVAGGATPPSGGELNLEAPGARDHAAALEAKRRVTRWFQDYDAIHRVEIGLVDPYYNDLALSLREASLHPPLVSAPTAAFGSVLKKWADESARYGATGNPYTPEESPGRLDLPNIPGLVQTPPAAAAMLEGLPVSGLVAVIEITQQADGHLLESVLLRSSGNQSFDSYVLGAVPTAVGRLPEPPDGGLGLHPDRLRSVWSFQGRTSFEHRWKEFNWVKDGWYLLATSPLALMTGRFDEVTGEGGFIDVRSPKMLCEVKLLRVY